MGKLAVDKRKDEKSEHNVNGKKGRSLSMNLHGAVRKRRRLCLSDRKRSSRDRNRRLCCIPNCPNNNLTLWGKRYVYPFPRDAQNCEKWLNSVPIKITNLNHNKMGVCTRHWPEDATFTWNSSHRRPADPPSIFNVSGEHLITKKKFLNVTSEKKTPTKTTHEISKSKQGTPMKSESRSSSNMRLNKKGPYSLRKVKSKKYDLMVKGIDAPPDEAQARVSDAETWADESELEFELDLEHEPEIDHETEPEPEPEPEPDPDGLKGIKARESLDDSSPKSESMELEIDTCELNAKAVDEVIELSDNSDNEKDRSTKMENWRKYAPPKLPNMSGKESMGSVFPKSDLSKTEVIISPESSEDDEPIKVIHANRNQGNPVKRILSKVYSCHYCHTIFPHEQLLTEHREASDCSLSDRRRMFCYECRIEFHRRVDMERHVLQHTSWGSMHLCLVCKQEIPWKDLHQHLVRHRFAPAIHS